ncbi:MAG: DUF3307 domain-containing protein [Gammaproteobacteria bacterium]|nr:DUF3307 domain-containing protein [Gammaproteobacteria bacterium]
MQMETTPQLFLIFILLVAFQVKHFIADFPLQREYMLRKTLPGWSFLAPLTVHCGVHAAGTLAIVLCVDPSKSWLAAVDFVLHFVMDRIKASPRYLGRFNDLSRPAYWNCFGIDQMVHHLTSYGIIWILVAST